MRLGMTSPVRKRSRWLRPERLLLSSLLLRRVFFDAQQTGDWQRACCLPVGCSEYEVHADIGQVRKCIVLSSQEAQLGLEALREDRDRVCIRTLACIDDILGHRIAEKDFQFVDSAGAGIVGEGQLVAQPGNGANGLVQIVLLCSRRGDAGDTGAAIGGSEAASNGIICQ